MQGHWARGLEETEYRDSSRERKRRRRDRGSGRVRGGAREPEAEKDAERGPVNGMTQIDKWDRKQPQGETQQTVTHSRGVGGGNKETEWARATLSRKASLCWG